MSQDRNIDLLEKLYKQGHYKNVLQKANKLIEKKGYAGNAYIHMYQVAALSKLQFDNQYTDHHSRVDLELEAAFNGWRLTPDYDKSLNDNEFIEVDLAELLESYEEQALKEKELADTKSIKNKIIKTPPTSTKVEEKVVTIEKKKWLDTIFDLSLQEKVISCAETYIGVPYRYGGRSEAGFDCSGYTGYIMEQFGYQLPRSARDQEAFVQKIPVKEAKKGDLVFFSHRKNIIAHVGIVISEPGEDLTMIHASSSRGIIISNVEESTYWKPRLRTAGRVISVID